MGEFSSEGVLRAAQSRFDVITKERRRAAAKTSAKGGGMRCPRRRVTIPLARLIRTKPQAVHASRRKPDLPVWDARRSEGPVAAPCAGAGGAAIRRERRRKINPAALRRGLDRAAQRVARGGRRHLARGGPRIPRAGRFRAGYARFLRRAHRLGAPAPRRAASSTP